MNSIDQDRSWARVRCAAVCQYRLTRWPDGLICRTCQRKALRRRGICTDCGVDRLLPGQRGEAAICRDCAGIARDFACARCGHEALPHQNGLCAACAVNDRLHELLDSSTGQFRPELQPLAMLLANAGNAETTLRWLRRPNGSTLLRELATGELALSHAGLNARAAGQTTTYLRGLLVAAGLLPEEDQVLVDFERWLRRRLTTLEDHPHQQVLRQFGLWHQLPRMRAKAARRRLPTGADLYARHQFKGAQSFLTWLVGTGRSLATLGQADLNRWFTAARRSDRDRCRGFLAWAMSTGHMRVGRLPALTGTVGPGMTQTERLDLLRNCATDNSSPLAARVAAVLVLLFAQPLTRIRVLTLDDIIVGDDDLAIRLGDPPSPVPQPFATLLLELSANRENLAVPGNASCRWLFPGRGPGQPVGYTALRQWVTSVGLHVGRARVSALRQLVLDVPPPVAATAFGFAHFTAHRHVEAAGGTWNRYATIDRASQQPSPA